MAALRRCRAFAGWGVSAAMLIAALPCSAAAPGLAAVVPPPAPDVQPLIGQDYPEDADQNRVADGLEARAAAATLSAPATLNDLASVELIFTAQITPQQLDAFQSLGGKIDYIYQSVSYGWNGRIPLGQVSALSAALGASLIQVAEPKPAQLHLDLATQSGRVRPTWAAGFAGAAAGFTGDANITIAVIDTGIDGTHTDLAGRQQYWKDYTSDNYSSPRDLIQHGTHVTSIALGTGAAGGSATGTLLYTQAENLFGVPNGQAILSLIGLPDASLTVNSTARWTGGGNATFGLSRQSVGTLPGTITWQTSSIGATPRSWATTFTPSTSNVYSATLVCNGLMNDTVVATSVTNYPGVGDGFNKFRGVAPSCKWAGAKAFTDSGLGSSDTIGSAIDGMVSVRVANNIKVMNLSLGINGNPGIDTAIRQKVNTAVNNGLVVCVSAGNDGTLNTTSQRQIDDPGRAALALTVAASNDVNRLTDYSSVGFTSPGSTSGQEEDYKPDLMAPGGSFYYTGIMAADSNTGDTASFADQQPNDYYNIQGTSMASPFAAGCAALVIDALQRQGTTWSFASGEHAKYVKMVLCATATESNANRENGSTSLSPTLQRATAGAGSFPLGKDRYEGYGMLNTDAAVEAVYLAYFHGSSVADTLGENFNDRRAWARSVNLAAGVQFAPSLVVPDTGDFDLYLYNSTPSTKGTPAILASSTNTSAGAAESLAYTPVAAATAILVIKRISGSGAFSLSTPALPADYNRDGHVDAQDMAHFTACALGPSVPQPDVDCDNADFDNDGDVDGADFGIWQRCYTGPAGAINPNCAS